MENLVNYSSEDDHEDSNTQNVASNGPPRRRHRSRKSSDSSSSSNIEAEGPSSYRKNTPGGSGNSINCGRSCVVTETTNNKQEMSSDKYRYRRPSGSLNVTRESDKGRGDYLDDKRYKNDRDTKSSKIYSKPNRHDYKNERSNDKYKDEYKRDANNQRSNEKREKQRDERDYQKSTTVSTTYRRDRDYKSSRDMRERDSHYDDTSSRHLYRSRHEHNDNSNRYEMKCQQNDRHKERHKEQRHHRRREPGSISPQNQRHNHHHHKHSRDGRHKNRLRYQRSRSHSHSHSPTHSRSQSHSPAHSRTPRSRSKERAPLEQARLTALVMERKLNTRKESTNTEEQNIENIIAKQKINSSVIEAVTSLPLSDKAPKQPNLIAVASISKNSNVPQAEPAVIQLPSYYNPSVINPNKYAEQVQKRKLLWGAKKSEETVTKWGNAQFSQDSDGKVASKFMRLMGFKGGAAAVASKPEEIEKVEKPSISSSVTTPDVKSREAMFNNMEQQYEVARQATHTMRGVGLGFSSQPRPF